MRSVARDCVFQILYSRLFNNVEDKELKESVFTKEKLSEDDRDFANSLLLKIFEHYDEIINDISSLAIGYSYERIYSTDKCALIMTICEMKYFDDIPSIVSISEGMELVRKYSTDDSPNFVNGILAKYKKVLENKDDNS